MANSRPSRAQRKHYRKSVKSSKRLRAYSPGKAPETTPERLKVMAALLFKIGAQSIYGDKAQSERIMYEGFMKLGGVYVKFLQLLMMRSQLFTKLSVPEKMAVYDRVAADDIDIKRLLASQLGANYQQIASVDQSPFAAGSFAQVYAAQHTDGTRLIVKVLRPSLIENIRGDLRVLSLVIFMIKHRLKIATDVKEMFKNFKSTVLKETDYFAEANNAEYFYNYFYEIPNVVIPRTYTNLCSHVIIVQEFVDGLAITDLIEAVGMGHSAEGYAKEKLGSDLVMQMGTLGRELIVSLFVADRVFGDPHPGNIKLMTDNRVGIIDFGIAGDPPEDRRAFMILLQDVVSICSGVFDAGTTFLNGMRFFTSDLFRAVTTISQSRGSDAGQGVDSTILDEIKKAAHQSLDNNQAQADIEALARSGRVSKIMNSVINNNNKFALHVTLDAGAAIAMRTADGYVSMLDSLDIVDKLIPSILQEGVDGVYAKGIMLKGHPETIEYEMAVNIASDWAQNLIESDPVFFSGLIHKLRNSITSNAKKGSKKVAGSLNIEENKTVLKPESD